MCVSSYLGLESSSFFSCLQSLLFRQKVVLALIFLYFGNDNSYVDDDAGNNSINDEDDMAD